MAEPLRGARIEVDCRVDRDVPMVTGDSDALCQVFINLLTNARDVLEELPPGRPRNITVNMSRDERRVIVSFSDTGPGISEETAARVFEPFFSTKTVGRGTGLGLAISHGIIFDHGGALTVRDPGTPGACFVIQLPLDHDGSP
jgi:histidine kinase